MRAQTTCSATKTRSRFQGLTVTRSTAGEGRWVEVRGNNEAMVSEEVENRALNAARRANMVQGLSHVASYLDLAALFPFIPKVERNCCRALKRR